jgi:DNA polymerase III sliding clamp (beta) subunit (PCNA family)
LKGKTVSTKVKIDKLVKAIEKGIVSIGMVEKDSSSFSDFGRLTINEQGITVKSCSSRASSCCSILLESDEEIVSVVNFSLSLPRLLGMLSSLSKDSFVEMSYENVKTDDYIGNLIFSSGKSAWKMPCLHSNLIPDMNLDEGEEVFSISRDILLEVISMISFAGNLNDANFTTNNICISVCNGKIYFGATDDLRCAAYVVDSPDSIGKKRFLLPIKSISKTIKTFDEGEMTVYSGNGFVRFKQNNYSVKLALPNDSDIENFPPFESLVNKDLPYKMRVMTNKLKSMATACFEMNREEFLIQTDNENINFYAVDKIGGMTYKSALSYTGDKINICIGVCSLFLVEYLKKNKEETVEIEFSESSGKPKFLKIKNGIGSHYIMKALVDLVNLPTEAEKHE